MDFVTYQKEVRKYDSTKNMGVLIPLMGLCGEIGGINSILKKRYRDRSSYSNFSTDLREELGDALWYLSSICSHLKVKLEAVANLNLRKTRSAPLTHTCKNFLDYQTLVTKANKSKKMLSCLSGISKNSASLFKIYTEEKDAKKDSKDFRQGMAKGVGDSLWYLANIASFYNLNLEFVAYRNLSKIKEIHDIGRRLRFDKNFPLNEQFPRKFRVTFKEEKRDSGFYVNMYMKGKKIGHDLDDNAHNEDYYRFHDVFHLSYVAILGWSPTIRKLMDRKRKSNTDTDRIQDGARAQFLEEGISLYLFSQAEKNNYFNGTKSIDLSVLKTLKELTKNLEVTSATYKQWEKTILEGYKIFRALTENRGGIVHLDLQKATITYKKLRNRLCV